MVTLAKYLYQLVKKKNKWEKRPIHKGLNLINKHETKLKYHMISQSQIKQRLHHLSFRRCIAQQYAF